MKYTKLVKADEDFEISLKYAKPILKGDMDRMISYCNGIIGLLNKDEISDEVCLEITNAVTDFFTHVRRLKRK